MKKLIPAVFLAFLLSGCTLFRVLNIVNRQALVEKDFYYVIPFESKDDMLLLKVSIGGKYFDFIFDTGAFTVLSDRISDEFRLVRHKGPRILDSQGNKQSIDFAVPDTISLGKLHFIKPGCGIYPFDSNPELSCFAFDGILGANLLKNAVCQINFSSHTLIITNSITKLQLSEKAVRLPFVKHITGQPIVSLKVDGIKIPNVILDYGSGAGFNLSSKRLIKKLYSDNSSYVKYNGYNAIGLFGKNNEVSLYYRPGNVSLQGWKLDSTLMVLTDNGISTIGVDFLQNYTVTLDFIKRVVYFEPSPGKKDEGLYTFGLTPLLDEGKLVVAGLFDPSPALEAGIHEGDQILNVDGKDLTSISRDQYCEILKKGIFPEDKDTAYIQIKTDNIIKSFTLVKKELLK